VATLQHRWLFWDGVPNVVADGTDKGAMDYAVCDLEWASAKPATPPVIERIGGAVAARPIARSESSQATKHVLDADEDVSIEIVEVDPFFVPIRDLLAIHVKLGGFDNIGAVMLRIYACADVSGQPKPVRPAEHFRLVHQVALYDAEIANLPTTDISRIEKTGDKKQRAEPRDAKYADDPVTPTPVGCMTHCHVEVWVAKKKARAANESTAYLKTDGNTRLDYQSAVEIHDKSVPRPAGARQPVDALGRNETILGCPLIESIVAGETPITVYDHEPDDELADPPGLKADGTTVYPDFPRQIKRALYQICQHSKIGMALLRDLAKAGNPAVHIFPSTQVAKFIEGVGTKPAIGVLHDKHVQDKVAQADTALRADTRQDTSPAHLANIKAFEVKKPFAKTATVFDPWVKGSAIKLAYDDIGASNGTGCESRYFFRPVNMLKIDADNYGVQMFREEKKVSIADLDREVTIGKPCVADYDAYRPQIIETPFFLALIHECVHARRFQLGLNGEWDRMVGGNPHPGSLLAKLGKDDRENLLLRYSNYNLEEYDTIEGKGAPVTLDDATFDHLVAKGVLKTTDPKKVNVTENFARKELGLVPRIKYEPGLTMIRGANATVAVPDSDLPQRKFVKPRRSALTPQRLTTTDFAAIRKEADLLLQELGIAPRAVVMQEGVNYFKLPDPKFGWTYTYGQTFTTQATRNSYADILYEQIYQRRVRGKALTAALGIIDPEIAAALADFDTDTKEGDAGRRLAISRRLMRVLIASQAADDLSRLMRIPQLKDMANTNSYSSGIQAFASAKVIENPDLARITDRAFYVPEVLTDDPRHLCHMLIHEPMHMHAFQNEGFMAWSFGALDPVGKDGAFGLRATSNEGMTETLARIITYRLNCKAKDTISKPELFGGLPSYEYPTQLVCQVLRDIDTAKGAGAGLKILAAAYFDGQWDPLNQVLATLPGPRYTKDFFGYVSRIQHQGGRYFPPGQDRDGCEAVAKLKSDFRLTWDLPDEMKRKVATGTYQDPVKHPAPLIGGIDCPLVPKPVVVPKANLETECYCCGTSFEIPTNDVRKAAI